MVSDSANAESAVLSQAALIFKIIFCWTLRIHVLFEYLHEFELNIGNNSGAHMGSIHEKIRDRKSCTAVPLIKAYLATTTIVPSNSGHISKNLRK
jgi:hypothetical protein